MSNKLNVKPVQGIVLQPERSMRRMKDQGATVPNNAYYRRLIKLGDIEEIRPVAVQSANPAVKPAAPAQEKPTQKPDKPK